MNEEDSKKSGPGLTKIILGFLVILAILGTIAYWLCDLSVKNRTQAILKNEQDIQRTWMDKSLDNIRAWRNEIVEQARYISSSEMFRLFVTDAKRFTPAELESFSDPDALHSSDDDIRSMAEQLVYMQDLLKDFTMRRAWSDARVLLPDTTPMVNLEFAVPLTKEQKELVQQAARTSRPGFGPIRQSPKGLVMDMADPLFEVLGARDPQTIAVLLLTVPLEKPLTNFLSRNREQQLAMLPRIIDKSGEQMNMALVGARGVVVEPVANPPKDLEGMPFERRLSLDGKTDVYSMAGRPSILKWLFVLETPATEVDDIISQQKTQIYSLGALATIGIALLTAFIWASHTTRTEKARAEKLDRLNKIISRQKQILSCINKSNLDGLLLVDSIGRIEVCNPAFMKIIEKTKGASSLDDLDYALQDDQETVNSDAAARLKLTDILADQAGIKLAQDMAVVQDNGKSATVEVVLPTLKTNGETENSLYRVTIYPYLEDSANKKTNIGGSLAIFTDITQFRRNKEINDARQHALISALGRAIESVDKNLVGHSDKMAGVAERLADELRMDKHQKDTLLLAARLSQIGKIFVSREILTKEGKLTPEELKEAQRAPEYADKVLHDLHFDLPVRETVREMGKYLDKAQEGSQKENISLCGRALAVINAFIAMTSARAWRKDGGMDPRKAIQVMAADSRFDSEVVKALGLVPPEDLEKIIGSHPENKA